MQTCIDCDINFLQRGSELIRHDGGGHICKECEARRVDKNIARYWNGSENKLIRFYFYSQRGLALLNEGRYLVMGVFALYYTLKLTNPIWLVGMFVVAVPVLIVLGWVAVHRVGKVVDWLNVQFSTHWGRYQYTLLETQVDLLKEIKEGVSKSG